MNHPPPATTAQSAQRPAPIDKEREFQKNELFFSTTDLKSLILDGNKVFIRVSGYSYEELLGKAHNIIRHPDMPRVVFKVLWDTIQSGDTIAAYVKNMAKDGSYYWVMAVVSPVPDGYVSVRFKPSSALFKACQEIYPKLLEHEKNLEESGHSRKEAMEGSATLLLETLRKSNIKDYEAFMWAAMSAEFENRHRQLKKKRSISGTDSAASTARALCRILDRCEEIATGLDGLSTSVEGLKRLNSQLNAQSKFIEELAMAVRMISFNSMIEAHRLGDEGATLSVISERMADHSDAIAACIPVLKSQIAELLPTVQKTVFDSCVCRLTIEMASNFCDELLDSRMDESESAKAWKNITVLVGNSFNRAWEKARSSFSVLSSGISRLGTQMKTLQDAVLSLEFVHISGKVEASRLVNPEAFETIFTQAGKRASDARSHAQAFEDELNKLIRDLKAIGQYEKRISDSVVNIGLELRVAREKGKK